MSRLSFLRYGLLPLALLAATVNPALAQDPLRVFAAGSLSGPLTVLAKQFQAATGEPVEMVFGPAGLLLERIERGEHADVFASANMAHPQQLAREGKATPPLIFIRNSLCVLARPELHLTTENLLAKLLAPAVRIGSSTPKADPGGDYAWMLFAKAGEIRPGARELLEGKAQQLVGGKYSPPAPPGQDAVKYFLESKQVDAFIGYCSSRETTPDTRFTKVTLPAELAVAADFGLSVLNPGSGPHDAAYRFALFLLTPAAQQTLVDYGFSR